MRQKVKQSGGNQALAQLMADKKKLAIAVLLISVMAIMWVRILAKNKPPVSASVLAAQAAVAQETQPKIKATYVALPHVEGRNDVLARDIFAGSKWEGFGAEANGARQPRSRNKNGNEPLSDTIEIIGKELKLEAIFSGKNPQASVSGVLVSPGGKLIVKHEGDQYEFKAVTINDNEVVLECKGVQMKLSMIRPTESAN